MNLSHVIHEFSFGPFFPAIAQPLDMTYAIANHREHDTFCFGIQPSGRAAYMLTFCGDAHWTQNSQSFSTF
jgi:hypothetical protein